MSKSRVLSIVIVEDEDLFGDLLESALTQRENLDVVARYKDPYRALEEIPTQGADVALVDIELGTGLNGIQLGLKLRESLPELGIALLSNHSDLHFASTLVKKKLVGWAYLHKKSVRNLGMLSDSLFNIAAGGVVIDPVLLSKLQDEPGTTTFELTKRQHEIVKLALEGLNNTSIANRLGVSNKTVENQMSIIYQKLGLFPELSGIHPRVQLVLKYLDQL